MPALNIGDQEPANQEQRNLRKMFRKRIAHFRGDGPTVAPPARLGWVVPAFLAVGMSATVGIVAIAGTHGTALAVLALLVVPIGVVLVGAGVRRGLRGTRKGDIRRTWWHILWMLIFASALVFRIRSVNQINQDPLDAWAIYRVGLELIVGAVLLTRLALRRPAWLGSMFRGFPGALTVFGVVCLASSAWSVFPAWTFYKSCEYLLDLALLAAIVEVASTVEAYESLFNWTWCLYGALLVSVWLGVGLWPKLALYPSGFKIGTLGVRLTGVMPAVSADDVGVFASILSVVCLCRLLPISGEKYARKWYVALLTASIVTMVFSQTRAAIAGFLLGLFLLLFFSKRLRKGTIFVLVVAPMLLISSAGAMLWAFLERGENAQQLASLSSRLVWWSFAWHKFMERPLLGFGAYAAGRFAVLAKIGMVDTSSLHSDFLEIIVGTGLWGLIPFLVALLGAWWFLARYLRRTTSSGPERQLAYEAIVVLGLLAFNSFLLPMLTWQAPQYFLVIVGYAEFLRRRQVLVHVTSLHPRRNLYPEPTPHAELS